MDKVIRHLTIDDLPYLEVMETGIENDYVKRIFERLISGNNQLYGMFWDDQLVSVGGYSIFAKSYAMLGRMRSDLRFRGNDLSTQLMSKVMKEALKLPDIQWVGANTQEENSPARRVLEKIGLTEQTVIHGATTKDVSMFEKGANSWQEVCNLERKKEWIDKLYIKTEAIFPYECYYPFPASANLFPHEKMREWSFYENDAATRVLITKKDFKKHAYLHAIYPWCDLTEQPGLWETISEAYRMLAADTEDETFIWLDLTKEQAHSLPNTHRFSLPSPWVLYGNSKQKSLSS